MQELHEQFEGLFSMNDCGFAFFKNDEDIQQAAEYLIRQQQNNKGFCVHEPVEEILIYQTFSETSLDKQNPVKPITVQKNSLLSPNDVFGNWFVRGSSLLKSTG